MIQAGILVENILEAAHGTTNKDLIKRVWKLLNQEYFTLCSQISIAGLRTKVEIDFSSAGTDGMYLPADLVGIDRVRDYDDQYEYAPRDMYDIEPDEYGYRYYTYEPEDEDLLFASDAVVSKGGSSFTSVATSALVSAGTSVLNQYVRFGTGFGMYKITGAASPFDISPKYYGPDITAGDIRIRPKETKKLVIIDQDESILQDRKVEVHYWKMPQPLYQDSDMIVLASTEVLELKVLRRMPEAKPFRPVSKQEIDDAIVEFKKINPDFPRKQNPRNKHNGVFSFNKNIYTNR